MDAERLLAAEQTVALAGVVTADVLSQQDRNMPRPRRLLAVLLFYGTMSLIASFGAGPARFAAAAGGVAALSALLFGVVGRGVIALLQRGTGLIAPTDAGQQPQGPTNPNRPPGSQTA